jgi:hypothetical protein
MAARAKSFDTWHTNRLRSVVDTGALLVPHAKEEGVGSQVVYAVVVHCAMQHRVKKGDS